MICPDRERFIQLAQQGNLIPVYREIVADTETPVSALRKLGVDGYAFLFESVEGGEKVGRYSFVGRDPYMVFENRGPQVRVRRNGQWEDRTLRDGETPLSALRDLMAGYRLVADDALPRFCGGAAGYLGYDLVRFFERLPHVPEDDLGLPDAVLMFVDALIIFDHVFHTMKVLVNAHIEGSPEEAYARAVARIEELVQKLRGGSVGGPLVEVQRSTRADDAPLLPHDLRANYTREDFERDVVRCQEYIAGGDIIQVVLSQRFSLPVCSHPFEVYRCLRSINPSPYMYYLSLGDLCLVGTSPEILVTYDRGEVRTRPIAGTRPRSLDPEVDARLERELLTDEKECAEHIMLVDLGRNDVGRVCRYGTVRVDELMAVERYSHVMHIVSNVVGEVAEGRDQFDVLEACFPAGTVSGAPKVRAMEIIDEMEPTKRGPYAGAIGYLGFSGNMDTCITIRTIVFSGGTAYVQAGAGIVADSVPSREYEECVNKARALLYAIEMAEEAMGNRQRATGNGQSKIQNPKSKTQDSNAPPPPQSEGPVSAPAPSGGDRDRPMRRSAAPGGSQPGWEAVEPQ